MIHQAHVVPPENYAACQLLNLTHQLLYELGPLQKENGTAPPAESFKSLTKARNDSIFNSYIITPEKQQKDTCLHMHNILLQFYL